MNHPKPVRRGEFFVSRIQRIKLYQRCNIERSESLIHL